LETPVTAASFSSTKKLAPRFALKERHVELVGHQRSADVPRQRPVPLDRRQRAGAAAFASRLLGRDGLLHAQLAHHRGDEHDRPASQELAKLPR
jgi:hypothetical protein